MKMCKNRDHLQIRLNKRLADSYKGDKLPKSCLENNNTFDEIQKQRKCKSTFSTKHYMIFDIIANDWNSIYDNNDAKISFDCFLDKIDKILDIYMFPKRSLKKTLSNVINHGLQQVF